MVCNKFLCVRCFSAASSFASPLPSHFIRWRTYYTIQYTSTHTHSYKRYTKCYCRRDITVKCKGILRERRHTQLYARMDAINFQDFNYFGKHKSYSQQRWCGEIGDATVWCNKARLRDTNRRRRTCNTRSNH